MTGVFGQIAEGELVLIFTAGTNAGFTFTVTGLDAAVVGEAHAMLDVTTTVTISPSIKDELLNVAALVPAFTPFTFHW